MDVVGSEIGQKMRSPVHKPAHQVTQNQHNLNFTSAIKAKLTELGCYVDDELPDYVMVMVANKRTRAQMEDDLQLFLGDNTELFVNWLHQVLKKLQEVTVPAIKPEEEKSKAKPPKQKKAKEKKDKVKTKLKKVVDKVKKAKKKEKLKEKSKDKLRKKAEKKTHKSKKKSKSHEMIRPNIPPLLMNMEKESEPSITDVFAGQILKNHGIAIDLPKEEKPEKKPDIREIKKPILPIIDPATIASPPETIETITLSDDKDNTNKDKDKSTKTVAVTTAAPREEQIKEMNEIEAKIQGLKQKLAEQLDSMSEDEDFLNIRTEAEELMNDFAEDVFQEISSQAPASTTPPVSPQKPSTPPKSPTKSSENSNDTPEIIETPKTKEPETPKTTEPETLPQIELNLPKRPVRERLGAKKTEEPKEKEKVSAKEKKRLKSPERLTPEREPDFWGKYRPVRSRLGSPPEPTRKSPITFKRRKEKSPSDSDSDANSNKEKQTATATASTASVGGRTCASVVHVKPRPRVAPASSLLLRAMADAHKSQLTIPPKVDTEPSKVKRALVHPMRRVDGQHIVVQIPSDPPLRLGSDGEKGNKLDTEKEEPNDKKGNSALLAPLAPLARLGPHPARRDDSLVIDPIDIHNSTIDKDKNTQFIVTMDGFSPNAFLAKKLKTEGLLEDDSDETTKESKSVLKISPTDNENSKTKEICKEKDDTTTEKLNITEKEGDSAKKTEYSAKMEEYSAKRKENSAKEEEYSAKRKEDNAKEKTIKEKVLVKLEKDEEKSEATKSRKKRSSDSSHDSETSEIIQPETITIKQEKNVDTFEGQKVSKKQRTSTENIKVEDSTPKKRKVCIQKEDKLSLSKKADNETSAEKSVPKRRKASPIVFERDDLERKRERTQSASSDNHVTVTTVPKTHKYDTVPPLSAAEKKLVWCRSFPMCRYGAGCAFLHPRCKFAAACTRRSCPYSHSGVAPDSPPVPSVASSVVPSPNFKSVTRSPTVCAYGPQCANASCRYLHPKPCRYGRACAEPALCNFYHPV